MAVPSQQKPPKVESDEQFSDEEATRRMNEVVKRMGNTPPKPHSAMKLGKRKTKTGAKANPNPKEMLNIDYNNPNAVTAFSAIFEQQLQPDAECLSEERCDPYQHSKQNDI